MKIEHVPPKKEKAAITLGNTIAMKPDIV